jgi:hypothetical protein
VSRPWLRTTVAAVAALIVLLASALPLRGLGILVVVALAGLDVTLVQATGGLAFRRRSGLDERERALRDLAYRRGFRWIGLGVVLLWLVWLLSYVAVTAGASGLKETDVDTGISGRILLSMVELLLLLPTCVVAWREEGAPAREWGELDGGRGRRRGWMAWLVLPALVTAWIAAVVWLPLQSAPHGSLSVAGGPSAATCQEFAGGAMVGSEFGATVGLRAYVCWDGAVAYIWGNPSLPTPTGALREEGVSGFASRDANPMAPLYSGCGLDNTADFATVSGTTCSERIDAAGTVHYAVSARVSPLPFGIASREVTVELVVTRDGRVLQQP